MNTSTNYHPTQDAARNEIKAEVNLDTWPNTFKMGYASYNEDGYRMASSDLTFFIDEYSDDDKRILAASLAKVSEEIFATLPEMDDDEQG